MATRSIRKPPLKVCHIVATTEGATWLFGQVRDLRDRFGYDVAVVLNGDRGTLVDRFRAAGIPVHVTDFDFTMGGKFFDLNRRVIALVRLLRRERFDVIQTHLFHSMLIGRIAAWIADVPVRLSRTAGPFHLEAHTSRWMDRATCWMDTTIIASCELIRTQYEELGVPRQRIAFINNGPDETRFDPSVTAPAALREEFGWPADTPLVGMVSYFYPELSHNGWTPPALQGRSVKCQDDLIRAAPLVLRDFPEARILFVGSGWGEEGEAYLRRMKDLVAEMGLERRVIFLGFRSDVPAILRAVDVAVQPSLSENLGGPKRC
jgi:glycosyltransferase involved in cell wall biosynthesis